MGTKISVGKTGKEQYKVKNSKKPAVADLGTKIPVGKTGKGQYKVKKVKNPPLPTWKRKFPSARRGKGNIKLKKVKTRRCRRKENNNPVYKKQANATLVASDLLNEKALHINVDQNGFLSLFVEQFFFPIAQGRLNYKYSIHQFAKEMQGFYKAFINF